MLTDQEIIHLYVNEKKSSYQISEIDGRSHVTIHNRLHANGIRLRTLKEAQAARGNNGWPEEQENALRQMWLSGRKAPEIAKVLGVSSDVVYAMRHRLGLPSRQRRAEGTNDMNGQYFGPVKHRPAVIPPQIPGWPTLSQLMAGR